MKCIKLRSASRWRGPCLMAVAAFLVLMTSVSVSATPVSGTANIGGSATVTGTSISFFDNLNTGGAFSASTPNTGSYTGETGGTITDLTGGPITGPDPISAFATFTVPTGNVIFDLQTIAAGNGTAGACLSNTVGNLCTPTGSPFTLDQVSANTVAITLVLSGVAHTGLATTGTSPTTAIFTAQRVPGTITDILGALSNGGSISQSYSATFASTAVPEPATFGLIGTALLGVGLLKFRRVRG